MPLFRFRRDPDDPIERLDRCRWLRPHRQVAGVSLDHDCQTVRAALVHITGYGKHLQARCAAVAQQSLGSELSRALRALRAARAPALPDRLHRAADLAEAQSNLIEQLQAHVDKAPEKIVAAGILDPGLWFTDFDGRLLYDSLSQPEAISQATGVSVVDALPAKDVAAGGHGWPLTPLAAWLLLADRTAPVAREDRWLIEFGDTVAATFLPASDGLDAEFPLLRCVQLPGLGLLNAALDALGLSPSPSPQPTAVPAPSPPRFQGAAEETLENWCREARPGSLKRFPTPPGWEACVAAIADTRRERPALVGAFKHWLSDSLRRHIEKTPATAEQQTWIIAGDPALRVDLQATEPLAAGTSIRPIEAWGLPTADLTPVFAAILATLHLDQQPANLPALTGASLPRVLGRLTPGAPANWRLLLRDMADHQPPVMRLRDAI